MSFEHERPGEKPHRLLHRLLHRILVGADLLDKVPQPCLAGRAAAGSVLLDNAVGEEQHPVTPLQRSIADHRRRPAKADRQGRRAGELGHEVRVPEEQRRWMSSVDPLQEPRSDIQPGHLSSHEPVGTELGGNRVVHGRVETIQTDVEAAGMPVGTPMARVAITAALSPWPIASTMARCRTSPLRA